MDDKRIVYSVGSVHIVVMAPESIYTVKKLIAMTPAMADAISDYRFRARVKAEAEAIRQLIEFGLAHTTGAAKREPPG